MARRYWSVALLVVAVALTWFIFSTGWNNGQADTIIYGGKIDNLQGCSPQTVEAVAISGKKLLFLGSKELAFKFKGRLTKLVDLKGKTLPNAFFDLYRK